MTKTDISRPDPSQLSDAANQLKEIRQGSATGPLLATLGYDFNGSLTSKTEGATTTTLTHDALNRLTQVAKTGLATQSYSYDQGRRIRKTVGTAASNYLYNGEDIYAEYANWSTPTALYTHGPNTDAPLIRIAGTGSQYYHQDGLGSVVGLSDPAGATVGTQRFDAWGNKLASTGTIPQYGFTGREPDETGLVYYRARYYDPTIGRFTQRDPIGLRGGINRYAYVGGNPVNFTDPDGQLSFPLHLGITYWAARDVGYGFTDSLSLAWKSMSVDFKSGSQGTTSDKTQQHIMGGSYINPITGVIDIQSPQQAITAGQQFIAGQIQGASTGGGFDAAANASHAIQDKYSLSHQGEEWAGFKELGVLGTLEHVWEDTVPGFDNIKGAYQETKTALESLRTGNTDTYLNSGYNSAANQQAQNMGQMTNPSLTPAYSDGAALRGK